MKDGYAHLLLRDVLSALSELGLKWRIRSIEYYDREGLQRAQARRTNGGFPPLPEPAASAPSIKADVSRLADEFFNGLDTPKEDIPT